MDHGNERRLMVHGEILSIYPLNGNWRPLRREYWWKALEAVPLPPRPAVLLVGLGGGTQVHLLYRLSDPRSITVIERDPVIVRIARQWFGLDRVGKLEMVCADAETAVAGLLAMVPLVTPLGSLVVNRHRHGDPRPLARTMRLYFNEVRLRRVRRTGENTLICCSRPLFSSSGGA